MNKEKCVELMRDNYFEISTDEEASAIYDFLVNNLNIKDKDLKDYIQDNLRLFTSKNDLFDWIYDEKLYPLEFLDDYCSETTISEDMVGKSLKDLVINQVSNKYIDYLKVSDDLFVYFVD